ncbi:MAG: FadR/GntR family transcriptional regulator [Anaerolineales bacterium]|jgi:DNA-binding FadR family transcriptional regulator
MNHNLDSEFFDFLVTSILEGDNDTDRIPSLSTLSKELGVSVARLREQLEVAKALGFVEARPRTGIRRLPYSFTPAIWQSLSFVIAIEPDQFMSFAVLRRQIELAFWNQAVQSLTNQDLVILKDLMKRAFQKLNGKPIRIPHTEHKQLHLMIYSRLNNPFVLGILEAFWEAYEAVRLNLYSEYNYLLEVWNYHQQMVDAICSGNFDAGYRALLEHTDLLYHHPEAMNSNDGP